jgi:cation diffusion facilitator family transporter
MTEMTRRHSGGDNSGMMFSSAKHFAWLSIAAAFITILLKALAWWLTGSIGLLSDALESLVNLAGAMMALAMISLAEQPADEAHAYGHGKAEYFSAGFEGLLILAAAVAIALGAIERLRNPQPLEQAWLGLTVSTIASVLNLATALTLLSAGRKYRSLTLEADARHLLTDVWTSAGVIAAVGAVSLTHWLWLDPVIALLVAANIVRTGWALTRRAIQGLMDQSLPAAEYAKIIAILDSYRSEGLDYHALRTRESGARRFVSVHILMPGAWTILRGHEYVERLEAEIRAALPQTTVITHFEPFEDPASHIDQGLDR